MREATRGVLPYFAPLEGVVDSLRPAHHRNTPRPAYHILIADRDFPSVAIAQFQQRVSAGLQLNRLALVVERDDDLFVGDGGAGGMPVGSGVISTVCPPPEETTGTVTAVKSTPSIMNTT